MDIPSKAENFHFTAPDFTRPAGGVRPRNCRLQGGQTEHGLVGVWALGVGRDRLANQSAPLPC